MPNRPTLKTIGQIAGLSHVAVSKALRDAPDISAATKERVRKIAEELGYTPNVAARNLYLQRAGAIGMVVPAMGESTAYDLLFNVVSAAAADMGYCVMLGSSHRNPRLEERHCRMMVGNQVGALIVAPCTSDVAPIKAACGPTPAIFIGGKTAPEEEYAILCDYRHSGALAVEHLTGLGHEDIALLTYEPENRTILQKEEGFAQAMRDRGLTPRIIRTGNAANTMQAGIEGVERLLEQKALPTASIVFLPLGMAAAKSLGYDEETGMAMVMLGTNAGFAAGIYNPFSVGIAQTIAELPLYSGAWLRWLLLAVLVPVTGAYIVRRAGKPALSGEAVLLADALCLSRQSAVLAFQLGDGLTNLVSPVSSTLVSCLAISGVSYPKWIRYFLPLVGLYLTVGTAFMLLAGAVGY